MELRQLEHFVAVAVEGGFGRAAQRLHIAQSAVSQAVRALERELGVELVDRSRRQIRLTPAGQFLLPKARAALDLRQEIHDIGQEFGRAVIGEVTMGVMTSVSLINVPAVLGRFHESHPGVTVRLRVSPEGSSGLVERLVAGEFDVAVVALPSVPKALVRVEPIASSPMVLVVPAGHRLADNGPVALTDLAGEDFVDLPVGYGVRRLVDDALLAADLDRDPALEVADLGTAAAYVAHGLGVALLPEFVAHTPGTTIVPVRDPLPEFTAAVATAAQRRTSAAVRALVEHLGNHSVSPRGWGEPNRVDPHAAPSSRGAGSVRLR